MLIRFFKKEYFISDKPVLITYCLLFEADLEATYFFDI